MFVNVRELLKSRFQAHTWWVCMGPVLNRNAHVDVYVAVAYPWHQIAAGRGVVGSAYAAAVQSEMIDTSLTGEVRGTGVGKVFAWTVNERRVVCSWGRFKLSSAPTKATRAFI